MEKSKLFEDVHVSAPSASKPVPVLSQQTSFNSLSTQNASRTNRTGLFFFGGGALCLAASMVLCLSSGVASKPKVILVKAPAVSTQTVDVHPSKSSSYGVDWQAASTSAASPASASQQAATLDNLNHEIARLRSVATMQQSQVDMLNAQIKSSVTPAPPLASPNGYTPLSLDQHGVVLTVNGRAFQCASREGAPVCVSISGTYLPRTTRRGY